MIFANRPQLYSAKYLFYNFTDIAFSSYGAYWRHIQKNCLLELLSTKRVLSYSSVREEEVARLVHRVARSYSGTINLSKMLGLYANYVLCRVAFGRYFSESEDYERYGFQKMLDEYQEVLGGFSVGDFFPSMEFIRSLLQIEENTKKTCTIKNEKRKKAISFH
ncbi:hypothetical protein Lal_00001659 [Lupinus albus]|nr:hypothetical protein Lal_00001659 [Lupinus albus]